MSESRMNPTLAREAAELYALPEADYTRARNARAKELRAEDPELGAAVAKLPKPSRALATINHLARDDPSEIRALIQAGRRLRELQEDAVRGKGTAADVPGAMSEFRASLERVQRQARERGLSGALLTRVASTLRTAAHDPELQPLLERGLLAEEPDAAGFALDPTLVPAAARRSPPKRTSVQRKRPAQDLKPARERLSEAKKSAREARKELARAREATGAAELAAAKAAAAVEEAEAELERLSSETSSP